MSFYLHNLGLASALGGTTEANARRLFAAQQRDDSPLVRTDAYSPDNPVHVGQIRADLPPVPEPLARFDCRNNRLLLHCLQQIEPSVRTLIESFGPARVGVALGTSTSGMAASEDATRVRVATGALPDDYHFIKQRLGGGADFLANVLGLHGPTQTVSTACSSSAAALGTAIRLLRQDLCDAVIVGGADTLCNFTVQGFSALDAVSQGISNPMSVNRDGINIGEAGALMILSREPSPVALLGVGASSDAHHISAPAPDGRGAEAAMRDALRQGAIEPDAVEYVNLHGTATPHNDQAESQAVARVFGEGVPCSSTKPLTGHTLGAAGILETAVCYLAMHEAYNPDGHAVPHLWDGERDPELSPLTLAAGQPGRPRVAISNSFAFGGNNAAVLLAQHAA